MNKELNDMIESFINGEYEADKFCYDFDEEYSKVNIEELEKEYIYVYDDINEACSLFDDSNTHDTRLLKENQFREKVKGYYKKVSTN